MRSRLKTLPDFDACSVALFIFMTMGAAVHARAQQVPVQTPRAGVHSTTAREHTAQAIPANSWTTGQITEAFQRTDANGDKAISRDEARMWTGLTRNFERFDANRDGSISSAEFDEALK